MKATLIGEEHIRHHEKINEINEFFTLINHLGIKEGEEFILHIDLGIHYCDNIDYKFLRVECHLRGSGPVVTDMNYVSFDVAGYKKHYQ